MSSDGVNIYIYIYMYIYGDITCEDANDKGAEYDQWANGDITV